jgi:hypothetical protein
MNSVKPRWRRVVQFPIVILATALAIVMTPGPAGADGVGLWQCKPFDDNLQYACTTITSAPAGGVQVLDRSTNQIYTLHNGNSVALYAWAKDTSGQCGIGGNDYVWMIDWQNAGRHWAYIGDHYLNTGDVPNWNNFPDRLGWLGNKKHALGFGSGTCDVLHIYAPWPDQGQSRQPRQR